MRIEKKSVIGYERSFISITLFVTKFTIFVKYTVKSECKYLTLLV